MKMEVTDKYEKYGHISYFRFLNVQKCGYRKDMRNSDYYVVLNY